jgi:hypothetical protein
VDLVGFKQIQEHVVKSMRAEGLMPISEFPVSVDGVQQLLPLFVGDTVPQAVDKFMRTHGIDPVHTDTMNARVLQRAEEEGLSPIAAYTVNVRTSHTRTHALTDFTSHSLTRSLTISP